jgi:hypothetical protein
MFALQSDNRSVPLTPPHNEQGWRLPAETQAEKNSGPVAGDAIVEK